MTFYPSPSTLPHLASSHQGGPCGADCPPVGGTRSAKRDVAHPWALSASQGAHPHPPTHPTTATPSSAFAKVRTQSAELHTSNCLAGSGCRCYCFCATSFVSSSSPPLSPLPCVSSALAARPRFLKLGGEKERTKHNMTQNENLPLEREVEALAPV